MYFHITTKCQMNCDHCVYSYGRGGERKDMPFGLFKRALDKYIDTIKEYNQYITLGGGEPTLHKDFWKILGYSMSKGATWLATNGGTSAALPLCELAKKGHVAVALSQDEWHDPINPTVPECFYEGLQEYDNESWTEYYHPQRWNGGRDLREVRTVKVPIRGGRAAKLNKLREGCPCPGLQIKVDGSLYPCGCDNAPKIGTIDEGIKDKEYKYLDVFYGCVNRPNPLYKEV